MVGGVFLLLLKHPNQKKTTKCRWVKGQFVSGESQAALWHSGFLHKKMQHFSWQSCSEVSNKILAGSLAGSLPLNIGRAPKSNRIFFQTSWLSQLAVKLGGVRLLI